MNNPTEKQPPTCPECRTRPRWNGALSHAPTCSRIDLETAKWYAAESQRRIDRERKYTRTFVEAAQRWEGKFRVVCHENNQLRKKLSSPNTGSEPCGQRAKPVGDSPAPAPSRYRLLDDADTIEKTDEGLLDNCTGWEAIGDMGRWFVGFRYNRTFFVPMRRPLPNA